MKHSSAASGRIKKHPQGAVRYVEGDLGDFDQKDEMFKRPLWDPDMLELGRKFYKDYVQPQQRPGYYLHDQALVNASWFLEDGFAQGVRGGQTGLYSWQLDGKFSFPRVPDGLKIIEESPELITRWVKKAAVFFGAALVGVCGLDRRWLYSRNYLITAEGGKSVENDLSGDLGTVIVIGVEMDYEAIRFSPAHPASAATGLGYSKMAFVVGLLAQYIRSLGYRAIASGNDTACSIIDAGFGELARNGLLITPAYGPRIRLAKVFTDLELVADRPIAFGVEKFCKVCKKCARLCPSQSIVHGDPSAEIHNSSNRKGVKAWHINAEKCFSFWVANQTDCSTCIRVCPFNKPKGMVHDLVRWSIKHLPRFNRFLVWADDRMGYGKWITSQKFWKE